MAETIGRPTRRCLHRGDSCGAGEDRLEDRDDSGSSRRRRGLFLRYLEKALAAGDLNVFSANRHLHEPAAFRRYLAPAHNTEWVVYAKPTRR
jgi:hypothetical protein